MDDARNPETLFLEHLGWIQRAAEMICAQNGVRGSEAEDFAAQVRLAIMEDDYAIIRSHRGESSLKTYLATIVGRRLVDHWRGERGRWRPSAAAQRLGPPAPELEALVYRDRYRLDQAGEKLRATGRTMLSDRELGDLLKLLPLRESLRRQEVSTSEVSETTAPGDLADSHVSSAERRALRDRVMATMGHAMAQLTPEERMIVRMHMVDQRSLADVARALKIEQKPLYRRVKRLRKRLRAIMEAEGVHGDDVQDVMEEVS